MGQLIRVTERAGAASPGADGAQVPGSDGAHVVVFDLNRSLTGMGHERYRSGSEVTGDRPCDRLARELLADGRVRSVHVYSNVVTVELERFASSDGLAEAISGLFTYYRPGVAVAEPAPAEPAPAEPAPA